MSDTPTLNRAANQMTTLGAARLRLPEVRELIDELGYRGKSTTFGELAIRMGRSVGHEVHFLGSATDGTNKGLFFFGADSKARLTQERRGKKDSGEGATA